MVEVSTSTGDAYTVLSCFPFSPLYTILAAPPGRNDWKEFMSFAEEVKKAEKVSALPVDYPPLRGPCAQTLGTT